VICLICRQAETLDGLTSVYFERGEMKLAVNHVPARVCPSCGEAYVEEDVAVRLLREADATSAERALDSVLDFGSIQPDDKIHS
jgi:YgiT-type zinc finger domain-containing protein